MADAAKPARRKSQRLLASDDLVKLLNFHKIDLNFDKASALDIYDALSKHTLLKGALPMKKDKTPYAFTSSLCTRHAITEAANAFAANGAGRAARAVAREAGTSVAAEAARAQELERGNASKSVLATESSTDLAALQAHEYGTWVRELLRTMPSKYALRLIGRFRLALEDPSGSLRPVCVSRAHDLNVEELLAHHLAEALVRETDSAVMKTYLVLDRKPTRKEVSGFLRQVHARATASPLPPREMRVVDEAYAGRASGACAAAGGRRLRGAFTDTETASCPLERILRSLDINREGPPKAAVPAAGATFLPEHARVALAEIPSSGNSLSGAAVRAEFTHVAPEQSRRLADAAQKRLNKATPAAPPAKRRRVSPAPPRS